MSDYCKEIKCPLWDGTLCHSKCINENGEPVCVQRDDAICTEEEPQVIAFMMESLPYHQYGDKMEENGFHCGLYNGYVGFKADLPRATCSGMKIEGKPLNDMVDIHFGLSCDSKLLDTACIIPLTDIPKDYLSYRVVGFDCMHAWDDKYNCDINFVKEQTMSLYEQICELIRNKYK